ncbi:MAG: 2-dehydro-3,6-dideoxy-6-sulfogluconate aldolase [Phycisphaerae bacterium]|nr:2-dehydro-3,6-dideoxy-6-sulfogluconate aldolase [Phycisphaerae bacterium]
MSIAQTLADGGRIHGTMVRLTRNPAIGLLAADAGLDFVMVDLEHGAHTVETLTDLAAAATGVGLPVLVRVPELSRGWVSRVLDAGASGVMVPMTETVEQARRIVEWAKYPPLGGRGLSSFGPNTAYRRLGDVTQLMADANREVLTIAQIETVAGVAAADQIAAVDGIDALLVGPHDLSVSLGHPGVVDTPDQDAAIARTADAARAAGKVFGLHGGTDLLARHLDKGLRFIMCDHDLGLLSRGLRELAKSLRAL